jgi:hypothetical protein
MGIPKLNVLPRVGACRGAIAVALDEPHGGPSGAVADRGARRRGVIRNAISVFSSPRPRWCLPTVALRFGWRACANHGGNAADPQGEVREWGVVSTWCPPLAHRRVPRWPPTLLRQGYGGRAGRPRGERHPRLGGESLGPRSGSWAGGAVACGMSALRWESWAKPCEGIMGWHLWSKRTF